MNRRVQYHGWNGVSDAKNLFSNRIRLGRMIGRIDILNKSEKLRLWVYDGVLCRKFSPIEIPYTDFVKSDVIVPKEVSNLESLLACQYIHISPN